MLNNLRTECEFGLYYFQESLFLSLTTFQPKESNRNGKKTAWNSLIEMLSANFTTEIFDFLWILFEWFFLFKLVGIYN